MFHTGKPQGDAGRVSTQVRATRLWTRERDASTPRVTVTGVDGGRGSSRIAAVVAVAALSSGCELLPPDPFATPDARPVRTTDAGPLDDEALAAHDLVRARAIPVPVPALESMVWDDAAAALADDWARTCRWAHSGTPGYGENLFATTQTDTKIGEVVARWASEAADYSYATNRCAPGKMCGHYTQLVWRQSTGVGCASAICDTGSPFGSGRWLNWVCEYVPAGNVIGFRPY